MRIVYIQFTNPAAYPPLEHGSRILAERNWNVWFLGTEARGSTRLEFPSHARIEVRRLPYVAPGARQKAHYLRFVAWCAAACRAIGPDWLYLSDPMAIPVGLLLERLLRVPVVYHEHDSPGEASSRMERALLAARCRLARRARVCVLPNEERGRLFEKAVGGPKRRLTVWNCPRKEEVRSGWTQTGEGKPALVFHGNLGDDYFPEAMFAALGPLTERVRVVVRGYDVSGTGANERRIRELAGKYGLRDLELKPPVPSRAEVWSDLSEGTLGLALFPAKPKNVNVAHLAGASNKVFDYMAAGLPVLVTDSPEWRELIVDRGYGLGCRTDDAASIAEAVSWVLGHPNDARAMGEAGRARILSDWNYETRFAPVVKLLEGQP